MDPEKPIILDADELYLLCNEYIYNEEEVVVTIVKKGKSIFVSVCCDTTGINKDDCGKECCFVLDEDNPIFGKRFRVLLGKGEDG